MYLIPYDYKKDINDSISVWDGFALGNFEKISKYLSFTYENENRPEEQLKTYLSKIKIKLKSIDDINCIPPIDNYLQMIANCGYT